MRYIKGKKAQTALELAVFGAILIFVIGSTIRSVVSRSMQQNQMLRSMRLAMTLSYVTTETAPIAGRNTASVLLVEDRLSVNSSKYGTLDRIPLMFQGSGTHSRHLMMPIDFGDSVDLPLFDMYVNGKHFVFSTAAFKYVYLTRKCSEITAATDPDEDCTEGYGPSNIHQYARGKSVGGGAIGGIPVIGVPVGIQYPSCADPDGPDLFGNYDCPDVGCPAHECPGADCSDCSETTTEHYERKTYRYWERHCFASRIVTTTYLSCADLDGPDPFGDYDCPDPSCRDCSTETEEVYSQVSTAEGSSGCPKLYTTVENHPLIEKWCDGTAACPDEGRNIPLDERFDLDRNNLDGLAGDAVVPPGERTGFAWQWFFVAPIEETKSQTTYFLSSIRSFSPFGAGTPNVAAFATLSIGEGMILPGGGVDPKNVRLDVDNDLKVEFIMSNIDGGAQPNIVDDNGVIRRIGVLDQQDGDLDMTINSTDEARAVRSFGFTRDLNLYAFVRSDRDGGGTYFQIDEGRLFSTDGDNRQFIRNTSRKDQVDLVERIFRLSNNTGGYCYELAAGAYCRRDDPGCAGGISYAQFYAIPEGNPQNPVEVCVAAPAECFSEENINRTCMAGDANLIFIRSRIHDLRGHAWVTDRSEDPYVNFAN